MGGGSRRIDDDGSTSGEASAPRSLPRGRTVLQAELPAWAVDPLVAAVGVTPDRDALSADRARLTFPIGGLERAAAEALHLAVAWAAVAVANQGARVVVRGPARPRAAELLGDEVVQPGTNRHAGRTHRSLLRRLEEHVGVTDGGDRLVGRRRSRAQQAQLRDEAARAAMSEQDQAAPGSVDLTVEVASLEVVPWADGERGVHTDLAVTPNGSGAVARLVAHQVLSDDLGYPVAVAHEVYEEGLVAPGQTVRVSVRGVMPASVVEGSIEVRCEAYTLQVVSMPPVVVPPPGGTAGSASPVDGPAGVQLRGWGLAREPATEGAPTTDEPRREQLRVTAVVDPTGDEPVTVELGVRLVARGEPLERKVIALGTLAPGQSAVGDARVYLRAGQPREGRAVELTLRVEQRVAQAPPLQVAGEP